MQAESCSSSWRGRGASPGSATGVARLLREPKDLTAVTDGDIVLARRATTALLPAVLRARAVVCEDGGLFSHMAVLARELGRPCVVGCQGILDAVEPGSVLEVDGTRGVVRGPAHTPARPALPRRVAPDGWVPVLRFGRFTSTFERVDSALGLDASVRIAALVSVPVVFGLGGPLPSLVEEGAVLVESAAYGNLVDGLVRGMERGEIDLGNLRARYERGLRWPGWDDPDTLLGGNDRALREYFALNQITWAAAMAKEDLGRQYVRFLGDHLPPLPEDERHALFLGTLAASGNSYIVDAWTRAGGTPAPWSTAVDGPERERHGRAAAGRWQDALSLRRRTLARLRADLPASAHAELVTWLARMDALVSLTERKNTDLTRCGLALFSGPAARSAAAVLVPEADSDGADASEEAWGMPSVAHVLDLLLPTDAAFAGRGPTGCDPGRPPMRP